jgi:CotH kinase protein/Chitobiase/beta-hexosaminidase C-terminal domain/Fn3 associated
VKRKQKTSLDRLRSLPWAIVPPVVALVLLSVAQMRAERRPMPPELGTPGGFYEEPFNLEVSSDAPGVVIRYTLDGAAPTTGNSHVYEGPIRIASTTVFRATAFRFGAAPSPVETATYLFLDGVARQPDRPEGYPDHWGGARAVYGMDSSVVDPPSGYLESVKLALRSLPTLSIVTDVEGLFEARSGIYANPMSRGVGWERTASVEFFGSHGALRFREDCGLRMFGKGGLDMDKLPKRSFRLIFRGRYGASRLRFPLFGGNASDTFDTVALRSVNQDSWHTQLEDDRETATYIRDQFVRELQSALGRPSFHGSFVHVYLNGLYWGIYNMCEWGDAAFAADYLGGNEDQYDVLKAREVSDGTLAAWLKVESLAGEKMAAEPTYRALQNYIDPDNLIDYLILNHYVANTDWTNNNWVAARRREAGAGFAFLAWDSEMVLRVVDKEWECPSWIVEEPRLGPRALGERLMRNPEFRRRFSDRVQSLFFNDGLLTPTAATRLWKSVAAEIDSAIVAESARWGHCHSGRRYTREGDWLPEIANIEEPFLARRRDVLLEQYRRAGVFPRIDAPAFNQHGGLVPRGFRLEVGASSGTVYYTLDGTDPCLPGGAINDDHAIAYDEPITLSGETQVKARTRDGDVWSALTEATFVVELVKTARR